MRESREVEASSDTDEWSWLERDDIAEGESRNNNREVEAGCG